MSVTTAVRTPSVNVLTRLETALIEKAMYDLVHNIERGATGLAPLINKSASTLSHEVNPQSNCHKLGLLDAVRLLKVNSSSNLLETLCTVLGFTLIPVRKFEGCSDIEVLTMYAQWHKEIGDVSHAVSEAFLDGELTHKEYGKILREGMETNAAFHSFLSRLEAIMEK